MAKKKNAMGYIYPGKIRDILRGEANSGKTQISMHISENSNLKEGDIITDEWNYDWVVKRSSDGKLYKEKQSKLEAARTPFWCPKCKLAMKKRLDTKMYQMHGMCLDCVVKRDTQMMIDGTYKDYEKTFMLSKAEGFLKDAKIEIEKYLAEPIKLEYVKGDGSIEKWDIDEVQVREFFKNELKFIDKELEKISKYKRGELEWI